jgi:hypothetical protein
MTFYSPSARTVGRLLKSLAISGGNRTAAAAYVQSQGWDDADIITRAAVGGMESGGANGWHNSLESDFLGLAWPQSLLGRMTMARRTTFTRAGLQQTSRPVAHWIGEGAGAKLSLPAMTRLARLTRYKVIAMWVASQEAIEEGAEEELALDLARATALALDESLMDGINTDGTSRPASILYGAPSVTSTGDIRQDVALALAAFDGDAQSACWIGHPTTGAAAGLQVVGGGSENSFGATGGRLAGLPFFTSMAVPADSSGSPLALVDMAGLQFAGGDAAELSTTTAGMVEQSDAPTGNTLDPASANTTQVSMFTSGSQATKAVLPCNWRVTRSGGVVVIDDADYGAAAA